MPENKGQHLWNGITKPAVIENDKLWANDVEDEAVKILKEAFIALAQSTYGHQYFQYRKTCIKNSEEAAEMLKKEFIETARKTGIPVWYPDSKSNIF